MNLEDLYRQIILDYSKNPCNIDLTEDMLRNRLKNPSCGDDIEVGVKIENGVIVDIQHRTSGCAISTASTSIMTNELKGLTTSEAIEKINAFLEYIKTGIEPKIEFEDAYALGGVNNFPARIKCAILGWETIKAILEKDGQDE